MLPHKKQMVLPPLVAPRKEEPTHDGDHLVVGGHKVKRKQARRESRASITLLEDHHRNLEFYKFVDARSIKDMVNEAIGMWIDQRKQQG